ncbi:DUF1692-domain-containing protein [Schizopora paradoxa]|uniref:DUF1692-domain-containing protein n=1 Tax=Schizopora paradoxa TaxID=27342 RepID=A0A0H2S6R3_9AGAM|nr:DUF1692-domain-containing protein [Schizopora paradoxa]
MSTYTEEESDSLLDKIDKAAPASLNQFDAFPKLPSSYKARTGGGGLLTVVVALVSFLLIVNDIGEWIWGWPHYSFDVDPNKGSFMDVNVDVLVNMPCGYLSVDLRDAVGDRLFLSRGFKRDGTLFDIGQAKTLEAHSKALDAQQAVTQSRKSRGMFATLFRKKSDFRPTYNHKPDGSACRIYGSLTVKKVTANLHITTLGHGYASAQHVDHKLMNLSHIVNTFSFGPYFPEMTQPLTNTLEITEEPFVAYQYFLTVVPTTYVPARGKPVQTNQYSVTHYTRELEHDRGTPGIFFKFEMEPLNMRVEQRTTTLIQFLIRVVGVVGGVWCCFGWALRVSYKAYDVATGADRQAGIVAAEATGASSKRKWGGGELRSRVTRQGNSWAVENGGSPYSSYTTTPVTPNFVPGSTYSPSLNGHGVNGNGNGAYGLGLGSPSLNGHLSTPPSPYAPQGGSYPSSPTVPMGMTPPLTHSPRLLSPSMPGFTAAPRSPSLPSGPPPRKDDSKKSD